jgi:aldehyde dehydrogenase (NAD+)
MFTSSLVSARAFAQTIEAGIVRINGQTAGADVHVPFGGIKGSGYGPHEQGRTALEFYTDLVTVYEDV